MVLMWARRGYLCCPQCWPAQPQGAHIFSGYKADLDYTLAFVPKLVPRFWRAQHRLACHLPYRRHTDHAARTYHTAYLPVYPPAHFPFTLSLSCFHFSPSKICHFKVLIQITYVVLVSAAAANIALSPPPPSSTSNSDLTPCTSQLCK